MNKLIASLIAGMLLVGGYALAQTPKSKTTLESDITNQLPNNTTGAITPAVVRALLNNFVASWQQYPALNAQTGTTYTFLTGDYGKLVTFSAGAAAVAVTLPAPSNFDTGWNAFVVNYGTGTVTITTTGSTIRNAATFALSANQSAWIVSDGSTTTNYSVWNFSSGTVTSVGMSVPCGVFSVTPSTIASTGTFAVTITGNSGGLPFYDSANCLQSSAALTANGVVYGGGAGVAPGATSSGATGTVLIGGTPPSLTSQVRVGTAGSVTGTLGMASSAGGVVTLTPNVTAQNIVLKMPTIDTQLVGRDTTDTLTNKAIDTATSTFAIAGSSVTANTGTGAMVRQGSPTLNFPFLSGRDIGINGAGTIFSTLPSASANVAALNISGQSVTGGMTVSTRALSAGPFTVECNSRPIHAFTNNAATTITAPNQDGFCIVLVTNGATAGALTFSGFSVGSNTGDTYVTTNAAKFSLFVWRANGTSGYTWSAHQ